MFLQNKLKAKIVERETSVDKVAAKIGMNSTTLYRKIKEGSFTIEDVDKIADILNLTVNDVNAIFFAQYVA